MEDGQVIVTTEVVTSSLNYYGNAHGGYLFTLCDQISGLVLISQGLDGVTLQSSINYLRAGHAGDKLTISGTCVHPGIHPVLTIVTIVATANHYVVDAIAGCAYFLLAWLFVTIVNSALLGNVRTPGETS